MLGLILYAVFVAVGLVVVSVLLSRLIIQAIRAQQQRQEQDAGLIDLASETVG